MNEFLPDVWERAVNGLGTNAASTSLGLIAFVTVILVLIERDALAGRSSTRRAASAFTAAALPLAVAVFAMLVARVLVIAD